MLLLLHNVFDGSNGDAALQTRLLFLFCGTPGSDLHAPLLVLNAGLTACAFTRMPLMNVELQDLLHGHVSDAGEF